MDVCVFCKETLASDVPVVTLTAKGCDGIARACELNQENIEVQPGQQVHVTCRKTFCSCTKYSEKKRQHDTESSSCRPATRQSLGSSFQYKCNCLFCGQADKFSGKKHSHKLLPVRTENFTKTVQAVCMSRDDSWAETVKARVEYAQDLHAADAVYHHVCSSNFRTGNQIPQQFLPDDAPPSKRSKKGRPQDSLKRDAFFQVVDHLVAHDDEQTTVNMLIEKMKENLPPEVEPYGFTHMKASLLDHFGDELIISEINGKANVVTFRHTADNIISDFYNEPKKTDANAEKMRIIETAARLLKSDVKSADSQSGEYPDTIQMSEENALSFLPESLCTFLRFLFIGKEGDRKVASIGQAIMQAIRPRVILAPLQLGLAVQMHYHFASRFLIDTLNRHGFCSPYYEVQRFERSAAITQGTDIPDFASGDFIQYMADNVDHNVRTLDGLNTFHGMGMICAITPAKPGTRGIPRISVTAEDVAAIGRVHIRHPPTACTGLQSLSYRQFHLPSYEDLDGKAMDSLWNISFLLKSPRPSWSGTMQSIYNGTHPGTSSMLFLPMIDLDPGNLSCIYSTLVFICDHAKKYGVIPLITFDQPLWWKALSIIESEPNDSELHKIVLRLGGFHTLMSFIGCIGHIMAGSGLKSALEQVYASNTVVHMLSGKAYERAVRGHLLVGAALNSMLGATSLGISLPATVSTVQQDSLQEPVDDTPDAEERGESTVVRLSSNQDQGMTDSISIAEKEAIEDDLNEVVQLYDDLMSSTTSMDQAKNSKSLENILSRIHTFKEALHEFPTSRLWLQYLDMIGIMCRFLRSERLGDWALHLQVLEEMLPYLAAAGHNLYTKSIHVYLQKMSQLATEYPEAQKIFTDGLHVVRRSNRFWGGLSSDLVIEQVLMRSLKTNGGLTRGRGMDESQRAVWLLSSPVCAEVNNAMQEFTKIKYSTNDQHKDLTKSRQERDMKDTGKLISFFSSRTPFSRNSSLYSIDTGVCAAPDVNADKAVTVGQVILNNMIDHNVLQHTFKKKEQIINMEKKSTITVCSEEVEIDPQLLFQRLITAGTNSGDLPEVFRHELCSYPPALFKSNHVLLEADKPSLANALWKEMPVNETRLPAKLEYVLDGGFLLHRVPWDTGDIWEDILTRFTQYVSKKYGQATIVFDGYESGPTTKDGAHARRTKGEIGPTVQFTNDMTCSLKKDKFLSNDVNKQRFIHILSTRLQEAGCTVLQATADADVLIAQTAIESARNTDTVLVGDDTDLLILLCSHAPDDIHQLFFRPEPKMNSKKESRCWNIKLLQQSLGKDVCDNLLFIHALLGCDTTSRLFGLGKAVALKKAKTSDYFIQQATVFRSPNASKADIVKAGENALVEIYHGRTGDALDHIRLQQFHQKVSSCTAHVQPRNLPPTSAATSLHSLRVYLQVQQWMGNELCPTDYGWAIQGNKMMPIPTKLQPAPAYLLEAIKCNCKSGCNTRRCGCRKFGLECSLACGECKGMFCSNASLLDVQDESDSDSEI